MSYVYILYIARTTSYVRCSTRCRMLHVRCRTCMTYDIVRDVRTYDIVGGKNPDVRRRPGRGGSRRRIPKTTAVAIARANHVEWPVFLRSCGLDSFQPGTGPVDPVSRPIPSRFRGHWLTKWLSSWILMSLSAGEMTRPELCGPARSAASPSR
jgi:hypothetical protein